MASRYRGRTHPKHEYWSVLPCRLVRYTQTEFSYDAIAFAHPIIIYLVCQHLIIYCLDFCHGLGLIWQRQNAMRKIRQTTINK
jgi:hypothetical protein